MSREARKGSSDRSIWPGTDAQRWSAGVVEEGCLSYPDAGSPQGGVVSPILANVFLHYVLDEWFAVPADVLRQLQ